MNPVKNTVSLVSLRVTKAYITNDAAYKQERQEVLTG